MGIRGLTTFIQSRSHLFMENFELHDCDLIIDGNSIACQLYNRRTKSYDCFGGDYDVYGNVVSDFYKLLKQCNITPYVVFDGGYERKKIATVISRMRSRINTARGLDINHGCSSVFPLCLRDTFLGITKKLDIKVVRCDFESDTEIANIARALDCPVLSYDSDFFIFDVLYIPFPTLESNLRNGKNKDCKYKYISCEIYRMENFLKSYDLDKNNLPILAALLGNDYVSRSIFSIFYRNLKVQKCHGNDAQKRIKSLIIWLQNETPETAISKVLSRFKTHRRKSVAMKIRRAMEGYYCCNSIYLKYLGIEPVSKEQIMQIDIDTLVENIQVECDGESNVSEESGNEDNSDATSANEELIESSSDDNNSKQIQPKDNVIADNMDSVFADDDIKSYFLERFRNCQYPACFMDIVVLNRYYCVPQVENYEEEQSHSVSLELISAINKLLKNSDEVLNCVVRTSRTNVGIVKVPPFSQELPNLLEIERHSVSYRRDILLDILNLRNAISSLDLVPTNWHIFILSIQYFIRNETVSWPIIYALLISKLMIQHGDSKLGFIRSTKSLQKVIPSLTASPNLIAADNINIYLLNDVSSIEYAFMLKNFISYFSIPVKLQRNPKLFDINIVHSVSQFQSCFLHIDYLNSLLNFPFENTLASETLNCTFIYHLAWDLAKRPNLDDFIERRFGEAKLLLGFFKRIVVEFRDFSMGKIQQSSKRRRRRKRKHTKSIEIEIEMVESDKEEKLYDPNNTFSILSC